LNQDADIAPKTLHKPRCLAQARVTRAAAWRRSWTPRWPRNTHCAWVVPAVSDTYRYAPGGAMCVARIDDAGKSWNVLRSGLPQANAYDLVLRHGLNHAM
jgi:hypothetical protein